MKGKNVLGSWFLVLRSRVRRFGAIAWAMGRCDAWCAWRMLRHLEGRCMFRAWDDSGLLMVAAVSGSLADHTVEVHRVFFMDESLPAELRREAQEEVNGKGRTAKV